MFENVPFRKLWANAWIFKIFIAKQHLLEPYEKFSTKSCSKSASDLVKFKIYPHGECKSLFSQEGIYRILFYSTFLKLPRIPWSLGIKIGNCLFLLNYFLKISIECVMLCDTVWCFAMLCQRCALALPALCSHCAHAVPTLCPRCAHAVRCCLMLCDALWCCEKPSMTKNC